MSELFLFVAKKDGRGFIGDGTLKRLVGMTLRLRHRRSRE